MATGSLVTLTALAVHSERQVVTLFVQNSKFEASKDQEHVKSPTLDLYLNLTEMNNNRRSHDYNDLASWEMFQHVVVSTSKSTEDFKLGKLCVDEMILKSINEFNSHVLKGSPCIGVVERRGNGSGLARASFPFPPTIHRPLSWIDLSFL